MSKASPDLSPSECTELTLCQQQVAAREKLIAVMQELSRSRELEAVLRIVRQAARELAGSDGATLVLKEGDSCYYADEDAISPLWKGQRFPMAICISGWVMLNKQSVVIEDIYQDDRIPQEAYRLTFVKSLAMVPIRSSNDVLGAIGNYWAETRLPTPEELHLLELLADSTAIALQNLQADKQLQASEAKYRQIIETTTEGVWTIDADNKTTFVNQQMATMLGYSVGELMGRQPHEFIKAQDAERLQAELEKHRRGNNAINEFELIRKDQTTVWVQSSSNSLFNEHGNYQGTLALVKDISKQKHAMALVYESEKRFHLMAEASSVMIVMSDTQGQVIYINQSCLSFFGRTFDELAQMDWVNFIHPDDRDIHWKKYTEGMASGENFSVEFRMMRQDGEYRWLYADIAPRRSSDGNILGYIGANIDITKRKQAQQALEESQERYQLVMQATNDGIWDWDLVNNTTYWNDRFFEILGLNCQEIPKPTPEDGFSLIHPDDLSMVTQAIQAHLEEHVPYRLEFRMRHSSGDYRYLRASAQAVWNQQGQPLRMAGAVTDITEAKDAENQIRESEQRFRSLAEQAPLMIWMTDQHGGNTYANQAWLEFVGQTQEENLGDGWAKPVYPDDRITEYKKFMQAYEKRGLYESEFRLKRKDGVYRWVMATGSPRYTLAGEFVGYIGLCQDITEKKQSAEALQESEERYRSIFDTVYDGIWEWDMKTNEIFWNDRLYEMHGLDKATFQPNLHTFMELVHSDDQQKLQDALDHHLNSGEPYLIEVRQLHSSGEYRTFYARGAALRDSDGKPYRMVGATLDITERKRIEAALIQNEARLRRVVDSDIIGIVFLDRYPGRITDANNAFLQMVGYTREEMLLGQINWRDMTPPEYQHLDQLAFEQMDRHPNGKCEPYEKQYITKDGRRIDILLAVAYYEERQNSGVAFILDITERKQAERALKESEERFRGLADASPFMVWMTDAQGNVNYHSKATLDFTGLTLEETLAQTWLDGVHPEDRDGFVSTFFESMKGHSPYSYEFRAKRQDGEYRWLLSMGVPRFDTENQFLGYIGSTLDITERKQAELDRQHHLEREQLRRKVMEIVTKSFALDSALDEIVRVVGQHFKADRCGLLRYDFENGELLVKLSNQYSPDFPPLPETESPFKSLGFLKQNPLNAKEPTLFQMSNLEQLTQESQPYFEKYTIKSKLAVEIHCQGRPYGLIGLHQCTHNRIWTTDDIALLQDIASHVGVAFSQAELFHQEKQARTELENYTRKLESSNRELEQFAVVTSHDLQEPLRKVMIFSQYLQQADGCQLSPQAKDYIDRMHNASQRMSVLITDLLTLSRIHRKGQPFQKTDLNQVVEEVVSDLHYQIERVNGKVNIETLCVIDADATQVYQLFQNLIGNALKFHRSDTPPEIKISYRPFDKYSCQIVVEDNGIGFDAKYSEQIFGIFERLHGRSQYEGTGIGLAICKKIVERHGGTITVHSIPDQGSSFMIALPYQQNDTSIPPIPDIEVIS